MPVLSFQKYMNYQARAIRVSGIPALDWVDTQAARFRRRVERRFVIQ